MTPAVAAADLRFTYREAQAPALDGISLQLAPGETLALMGRSGAGKSTLCRCLNGLIPHFQKGDFSGSVQVFGRDTRQDAVAALARSVGMVFQDFEAQLFSTRVDLEAAFAPENLGVERSEIARRVAQVLDLVGLRGFERRSPASLSGGEKQRLAIASVLAAMPQLLVMDEPTSDLDPAGKQEVIEVAGRLREDLTLVLVEHEAERVAAATRIALMEGGRIAAEGPPAQVLCDPALLEAHGVRPPEMAALYRRLGLEPGPLNAEDAAADLRRRGLRCDAARHAQACRERAARRPAYGEPVVQIERLEHRYDGSPPAVSGVDLEIRRGEFVAIVGQNGSGKTTLAKHLNGLLRPTAGRVVVAGEDVQRQSPLAVSRRVGYVFQNPDHQIFAGTVADEVAFGPRNFGLDEAEVARRVAESLEAVDLSGFEERDPFVLTKGERQRVAVASMLASQPEVLIFDEPTTGLDYPQTRGMMELIRRLNQAGHTIIVVTHSMWVVAEYAHRAVVMKDGGVLLDDDVRSALSRTDLLEASRLRPTPIVTLGLALGGATLTVEEAARCLGAAAH